MKKNLKIITKQEFTSLYRFGFLPKDLNRIITEDESSDSFDDRFIERLMQLPYFSGDEEYLTIVFIEPEKEKNSIEIEEVLEVIPFTEAARTSYQQKFDSRIDIQTARFERLVTEVELKIDVEDKMLGAKALWRMLNTHELSEHYVQKKDVEIALGARRNGQKSAEIQETFDAHLLTYERYEFFPNTYLGYFYDVGEIYAHSIGKPTFKGSGLYNFLESIKDEKRETLLSKLIDYIEECEEVLKFKTKCTKGNLKQYLVGVLFLMFKDELADKESINETEIKAKVDWTKSNKNYVEELNYAIYLTGLFFGFSKFYNDLYDYKELPIFGGKISVDQKVAKETNKGVKNSHEKNDEIFENQETNQEVVNEIRNGADVISESDRKINEIREQIKEILLKEPNNQIKIVGDVYKKTFTKLLDPIMEVDNPKKPDYLEVLKKEFSDISTLKKKNVLHLSNKLL